MRVIPAIRRPRVCTAQRDSTRGPGCVMSASVRDCFICASCTGGPEVPDLDRPLRRQPGVGAVIAGAGPLRIGYVLIVPEEHYGDIGTAIRQNPSFLTFMVRSLDHYETLFGKYTLWEHGSAMLPGRTSGCVEHAHLNVIPQVPLSAPDDALSIGTWSEFARSAVAPYLLLGGSHGDLLLGRDSGISQHYRRQWAAEVGEPERWDYALPGGSRLQRETMTRYLTGLRANGSPPQAQAR